MIQVDEKKIKDIYSEETVAYYKSCRENSFFNDGLVNPSFRKILLSLNPQDKKILDVGCGYGADLEYLIQNGARDLTAIDLSSACVKAVKKNPFLNDVTVYEQSIYDIKLKEKFDIAYSNMTLDQIDDLSLAIGNVAKVLNTNGYYIFSAVHPLNSATNDYKTPLKDYFSKFRGRYNPKTLNKELFFYHRPISIYAEILKMNGFVITDISEPRPIQKFFSIHYQKSLIYNNVPAALIICAQKIK